MRHARWLLLPATLALAWAAGFAWFVATAWRPPLAPPHADGIVVLTGGAERVSAGLHLLQNNAADLLLVSGVGRAAEFPELAHRAGIEPSQIALLAPRVTLGRVAVSTRGNAAETADWVALHHIAALIVVTAGYHMPRALAELRRRLPGVRLSPFTVQPPGVRAIGDVATWRLLAGEYTKFLAAELGLAELAARLGLLALVERGG
jgi:uncharacterized SAM-binding protein YcdF (DUF218 family)